MNERQLRLAWEAFMQGRHPPPALRPVVLESWRRSQQHRIQASRHHAPLLGEPELFRRRTAGASLLQAARPALAKARTFLADANAMVLLTDAAGTIIEASGDPRVLEFGRRIHLQQGGLWTEAAIGTNAIGTALASGEPVQIHAAEHFCDEVQRWTCAATPIHHPLDGQLLGILDISGPASSFHPQSLAHAVMAGQHIEAMLERAIRAEHDRLLQSLVRRRPDWLADELLAVDPRGIVVHATEHALPGLERLHPGLLQGRTLPALAGSPCEHWPELLARLLPGGTVELVQHEGRALGAVLVLRSRRRPPAASTAPAAAARPEAAGFEAILGQSPALRAVIERARRFAASDAPVLIEGETGVGKELFARAIHQDSAARRGAFVPINCGGLPRELIASELFGYAEGAFTGARSKGHAGRIEAAQDGLLCLDEIGEMPLELQAFLLRVLEDGVVYPIGSNEGRKVRVRIVSMTNRNLAAEVAAGRFRQDLYYRLATLRLAIPPLRERRDDVPALAVHYCRLAAARLGRPAPELGEDALALLRDYWWPGNVRQLRNVIEAMVVAAEHPCLGAGDVPTELLPGTALDAPAPMPGPEAAPASLKATERAAILAAVRACHGNLTRAARQLGIARSTLYRRLQELGLEAD
ncbi:Sigma-54-dependent Fis family transcriptional regulator [Rhodovastum atsumiense]|uniref:Sigma-54-dependent Fis family transcriptional regulator n=1 Tax=Rhodovastum atsumiense TaxID=504468 RepID=A0A5M6IKJ3_9PROT|nr:sigma-54-dependent Fis family transcriptional regulator [Rhodovastum atsumiense]KAA5608770.1 sigma-54-dependent Fis family transcriptional regulator [Rhodovastum atsumiense]CAH2602881.1 Sigma-54-dependent Fis family transcriptional regulator [Rhodovastum atsumiense]